MTSSNTCTQKNVLIYKSNGFLFLNICFTDLIGKKSFALVYLLEKNVWVTPLNRIMRGQYYGAPEPQVTVSASEVREVRTLGPKVGVGDIRRYIWLCK